MAQFRLRATLLRVLGCAVVAGLLLSGIASGSPPSARAQGQESGRPTGLADDASQGGPVVLVPGTQEVDPAVEVGVLHALEGAPEVLAAAPYFTITSLRREPEWVFASVLGLAQVGEDQTWGMQDGVWFGLVLLRRQEFGTWNGAVQGTEAFSSLIAEVPAEILDVTAKQDLDPRQPTPMTSQSSYIFPWQAGSTMFYGSSGVHDNGFDFKAQGWQAVDMLSDGNTDAGHAPNHLLAAAAGTISYKCQDANNIAILLGPFFYTHLDATAPVAVGQSYVQGAELGPMKVGAFGSSGVGCGWAAQNPDWFQVHWGFPDADLQVENWTLSMSTENWTNGNATISPGGGWIPAGAGTGVDCSAVSFAGVILYENDNCNRDSFGESLEFTSASPWTDLQPGLNNAVSSIYVADGWSVKVHAQSSGAGGGSWSCLSQSAASLAALNYEFVAIAALVGDTISSVEIFEDRYCGDVRFAVIGDYGGNAGLPGEVDPEGDVAALVHGWQPDLILTVGDNNYPVGASSAIDANIGQYYHDFLYPCSGAYGACASVNRFFPSLGNHDWYSAPYPPGSADPYLAYFGLPASSSGNERYYDFVQGPVHFFMLDSDASEPDGNTALSTQALWLQAQLAASTSPWKLVFLHHAPYSSGPHGADAGDAGRMMRWPFADWGADAVLAGHDHTYERLLKDGLPYFVDGLGGYTIYGFPNVLPESQVRYNADFGAMLADATPQHISLRFMTRAGQLIDTFAMSKGTVRRSDFDSDRQADPALFKKANGNWYVDGSATGYFTPALGFGNETDYIPVPGDYDGDGESDPAVFEKATGNWFAVGSTAGFFHPALGFGNATDYIPVPGDYDGDGRTDAAVFKKATGDWWVVGSSRGIFHPALGFGSDANYIPVPGDYDGDGKTDPAVFKRATGDWFVVGSSAGIFHPALNFGNETEYIPVPGDYDGDGKTDPAVFKRASGNWFAVGSDRGFFKLALSFGNDTDYIPQPADFDGDGLTDAAVFERNTGNWFVVGSTRGFFTPVLGFGSSNYSPVTWAPR